MTQVQTQPHSAPALAAEPSEFGKLLQQSAQFRMAPLVTEDRVLEFMDDEGIMATIAHAFPDPKLTDGERAKKARRLIEEARIVISASDSKVKGPLLRCTTDSFVQAISNCASLDLSLSKALGQACFVPYGNAATFMTMYQGLITLMVRTGMVVSVQSETVFKGELDSCVIENGKPIIHRKRFDCDRSDAAIVGVYAEARCLAGPPLNVILNQQELAKVERSSKAKDGPWKWWRGEQCKKSAVRRLYKQVAKGGDAEANAILARAIEMDNRDFGLASTEAESGLRDYGRSVRERARQAKAQKPPQASEGAPGSTNDAKPPTAALDTAWRLWLPLMKKAAAENPGDWPEPGNEANRATWFKAHIDSIFCKNMDPNTMDESQWSAVVADLKTHADPRPKDQR